MAPWYRNADKLQVEEFEVEQKIQECPQESIISSGLTSSESVSTPWMGKMSDIQSDQDTSNRGKEKPFDKDQLLNIDIPSSEKGRETEPTKIQPRSSIRIKYRVKKLNLFNHLACMSQGIRYTDEPATFEEVVRDTLQGIG